MSSGAMAARAGGLVASRAEFLSAAAVADEKVHVEHRSTGKTVCSLKSDGGKEGAG